MIVLLYRWRVDPMKEDQFIENWRSITQYYVENCGSFGSRLHRGSDGLFYGYAQWPDIETRERATLDPSLGSAGQKMRDAVSESFPEIKLEPVADHLVPQSSK